MPQPEASVSRDRVLLSAALAGALGFIFAFRPLAGMDFPWHLAMGEAHLQVGPWLTDDPLTHLPLVRPPDMGSWGGQVLFALADRLGGLTLVRCVLGLVSALLLVQVHRLAFRRTQSVRLAWLAVAFVAAAAVHRLRGRPDLMSLLFAFILVDQLLRPVSRRRTALVFLASLIWANIHPAAVAAPFLAFAATPGAGWRTRLSDAVVALVGVCLTPRGPLFTASLVMDTARTAPLVPEWQPLWRLPWPTFAGEWGLLVAGVGFALWGLRGADRRPALAVACIALAIKGVRLLYFLGVPVIETLAARRDALEATPARRRLVVAATGVLLIAFPVRDRLIAAQRCREVGLSPMADLYDPNYPVAAAGFLRRSGLRGHLFSPVKWGGYLGRELAPELRSAHDGRIVLFGYDLAAELLRFPESRAVRDDLVGRYQLEVLVLPPGLLTGEELFDPRAPGAPARRWVPVFGDPVASVYVDRSGPNWPANRVALARLAR